jgi:lipopolysaccharide transport system permease protein
LPIVGRSPLPHGPALTSSVQHTPVPERLAGDDVVTVRVPSDARLRPREILGYGSLIRALASRDIKARYKQTLLGPAWVVFQPLALLAAFSVGFKSVANIQTGGVPYFLFAMVGLTVWTYFQATVMTATGSIVNNYALVRWTACPRLAMPLATLVSCSPSFAVTASVTLVAAAVGGYLSIATLVVPLLTVWLVALTAAGSVFLAAVSVRARDVLSALPFVLQVTVFLAPVGYPTSKLPSNLQTLISLNPLTGLIEAWRWAVLGISPDMTAVGFSLVITALLLLVAWKTFSAVEVVMSDEI